jgi:shikimate dehydrogenase
MPDEYPHPVAPPKQNDRTLRAGLLGSGVKHSASPQVHSLAAKLADVHLDYSLHDISHESQLKSELERLHTAGYRGLNVTMPFKQAVQSHLLGMSPEAIATGSVNLLLRHDEGWIGENTDLEGFMQPLVRRRLAFSRVLLLGTGGAAHAVLGALLSMPFVQSVQIASRNESSAQPLVDAHDDEARPVRFLSYDGQADPATDLIVNATPLGMLEHFPDEMPCPESWLPQEGACFDLVSSPRMTPFLKAAQARDLITIPGLEMLVFQARRAFEAWTGKPFQTEAILDEFNL